MASTPSSAPVRPADCATVEQSPPDFSWPDLSADALYRFTLTYPHGHTRSRDVSANWINWDEVLPAGTYRWQVEVTNASGTRSSRTRRFTVMEGAVPFVVPHWTMLFERAAAKTHPRALPDASTLEAILEQRHSGLASLLAQVEASLGAAPQAEPIHSSSKAITVAAKAECERTRAAAFAWIVTRQEKYLDEAVRRAQNLAAWDPDGTTAYANADEASRLIAGTLTLAYDWLFPRLDEGQKALLLSAIRSRAKHIYDDLIGGGRSRLAVHPYDSHGNVALTLLAGMSTVLAGDLAEAQIGLRDALPLAINWTSPWGGEDGGFGNGSAYATWTTGDLLLAWYTLRWVVGVDLAQKAWMRNFASYLAYFLPPGAATGTFGDGAELRLAEKWATFGKAYALFAPSQLSRWYASQLQGEDASRLELLLAPLEDTGSAAFPPGTRNATLLPSIGWAAMHSDLRDPARVSVYFKSSAYGSFNHSHADQNSFVVSAGGQPLAIDSGYYDDYDSLHWRQWYKQTRAHNAITYDGGVGQRVFEISGEVSAGSITRFASHADHDIVQGDATAAYGGSSGEQARRSLVYLRPNLIVVYDKLMSDHPNQWEWNIHAVNQMTVLSDRSIAIQNNGERLCIDLLAGPPTRLTQTSQFSADPIDTRQPQWHARFSTSSKSAFAEFIALMRVGCLTTPASATQTEGSWTVSVGERTVIIDANGEISVTP